MPAIVKSYKKIYKYLTIAAISLCFCTPPLPQKTKKNNPPVSSVFWWPPKGWSFHNGMARHTSGTVDHDLPSMGWVYVHVSSRNREKGRVGLVLLSPTL